MADRFRHIRRIHFAETDLAGITHFANFFRYMEETEHAFYRSLGLSVHPADEHIGWPRVSASCDFKKPLKFEEEFEVELLVEEIRTRSIAFRFHFWKEPDGERVLAAVGKIVAVCVQLPTDDQPMQAIQIPDTYLDVVAEAPAEAFKISN